MRSSPRFWKIASVVVVLLLAYVGWMFMLRPAFNQVSAVNAETDSTWQQVETERARTLQLAEQKKDLQVQVDELLKLREKIPKDVDVPALMRTIQADAESEGVVLDTLQPGEITLFPVAEPSPSPSASGSASPEAADQATPAPKPVETDLGQGLAPEDAGLAYVPLSLSGQGTYTAVRDFISRLEHQQRAFLVTVLSMSRSTDDRSKKPLTFTMEGRVFVLNARELQLPASVREGR